VGTIAACHGWSRTDTVLAGAMALVEAGDYYTTKQGIQMGCVEANPIVGRCGQNVAPEVFFPVTWAVQMAGAALIPKGRGRTGYQAFLVGFSGATAWANHVNIEQNRSHGVGQ
jgi:hypothetical protein